jgi:replicative DNA helicase
MSVAEEYIATHGMPVSLDCERSILGAILLDAFSYNEAASSVQVEDFSLDSHRRIFSAMLEMGEHGTHIDLITVSEFLARKKQLEAAGGVAYLSDLTSGVVRHASIEHYCGMVRDKSRSRLLIHAANATIARLVDGEPIDDTLPDLQQRVIEIVYHGRQGMGLDVKTAARDTALRIMHIRKMETRCIGVPTGLRDLDELTTGYRAGEFYAIGARPGNGKTAFMCQAIREQVDAGHKPGVFSVEVDREQIILRLACQETNIPVIDTRDPRLMRGDDLHRLVEAIANIGEWPMFLEDSPRLTIKQLGAIARMWIAKGCDCIWVDFLQKLRVPGARGDFERVTAIADGLWELGRTTGVPVVALSQLKRLEGNPAPTLDDFRSSGEIEQNANGGFLLWRPTRETSDGGQEWTGEDQFIVAKNRSGPAGMHVRVTFDGPIGMYRPRL